MGIELRRTLRALAASPGFTIVTVASLAIGIGANVAIFGAVRVLLLDTLPVGAADQLVHVAWTEPPAPLEISQINSAGYRDPASGANLRSNFTYAQYQALTARADDTIALTGYVFLREISVAAGGRPPVVAGGVLADGRYFSTLGLTTAIGRPLATGDDRPGAPPVAVISHRFWTTAFGGDPEIVGRTMRVNGTPVEVIGVTPPGFAGLSRGGIFPESDVTLPIWMQPTVAAQWAGDRQPLFGADHVYWLRLLGRVPDREASDRIAQALTPVFRALLPAEARDAATPPAIRLLPGARGEPTASSNERPLLILMGVAGIVLLIACLNVAGLLLARGVARQREIAVRRAVGASRARVMRELLLESAVLAIAGAAAGVLLAFWSRTLLASMLTGGLGTAAFGVVRLEMPIDWLLVASAAAAAALTAVLCGVLPALRLSNVDANAALRQRAAGSMPVLGVGRALIAAQIAISVPLLVGALIFLRTIGNLAAVELGFDPRGVAFFRLNPDYARMARDEYPALYLDVLRRVAQVPGVQSATLVENALMSGLTSSNRAVVDWREHNVLLNAAGPRFVETMGMRLVAGRAPDERDGRGRPHVAMVNEAAVSQIFGGRSPIGQAVRIGPREVEIVGVVGDSRYTRPRAAVRPVIFDAALQRAGFGGHHVVIRASRPLAAIEAEVRRAVAAVHPDLPVPELRSQVAQIAQATARERVFAQLLTVFGAFALLLAGIGLHGVTAYSVARRTTEIGVRVAVGAAPRDVIWLVARHVVALVAAGLLLGVPAAVALGPLVQSLLYGVAASDAFLIGCAAAAMAVVAGIAAARPAWRAARINVAEAMRAEG
jgi:predicted permease